MRFARQAAIGLLVLMAAADACAQQSNEQNFREQQAVQQQQHAASQARQGYEASQYGATAPGMAATHPGYTPPVVDDGYRSSYGAVAFGTKAGAVSVWYSGEADSFALAEAEALRKCTADGGNGCAVAETGIDGYIGVAVAADGTRFAKYRASSEHDALQLAVGACQYGANKQGCKAERAYPVLPRRTR